MSSRFLPPLAAVCLLTFTSPAFAQLDPQSKTPYLWRVVLKVQPHPLLSPTLREQVRRDLQAALQPTIGALGAVEVVDLAETSRDLWDPLWQQFDDKGFAALETPRDLSGVKTHFLKLEYRDGQYQLEARQHDGFSGLSSGYAGFGSPVIRRQSVRSAELVGRTAGLLLDRDFGLDGTVELIPANATLVNVLVRGGQLGPLDRFVKPGDVFAVSEVFAINRKAPVQRTKTGKIIEPKAGEKVEPGYSSKLRTSSILKVREVGPDGVLKCEILGRPFQAPQGALAGFRCMKLGTVEAPLTVRLAKNAAQRVSVRASEKGFDESTNARDMLVLDNKDGLLHSSRPFANLACITVTLGPTQSKRFPVPMLSSDPVNLAVEVSQEAEEKAAFDRASVALLNEAVDARQAQMACFAALETLIDKQKNTEALNRARSGYLSAKTASQSIVEELKHLRETQEKNPKYSTRALTVIQQTLAVLEQSNKQLESHIDALDKAVAQENNPALIQLQSVQERIKILIGRGEIDQALNAYDQLITLLPDDAAIKANKDKLKQEWATKGEAHAAARTYLLKTWPALATIPDLKDSEKQLGNAIAECKKQGDKHTLRRLLVIFSGALVKLNELVAALDPNSEADKKLVEDARVAGEFLAAREQEIRDFVK